MQAPWMKKHKEIMELEEKKSKLLSEIEVFENRKRELVETLDKIRKEVSVHGGDYDEITKQRIDVIDDLDEKFVSLQLETKDKEDKKELLSKTINNLLNSISEFTKEEENKKNIKNMLNSEIETLKSTLNEIKLQKNEEETKKRKLLDEITTELHDKKEELRRVKKESEEAKNYILKEERLLSIKRSDLEIYEARMRKKYPNDAFILKQ
jgi:chromosome segregation ATPase